MLSASLQVELPAIAADGHLHDLRGTLVDRGDADVALDLLHHVLVRVAVSAQRLDAGFGGGIPRLGGQVLGDRTLGVQASFARVDALGSLFDEGPARFQTDDVRNDQLVGVTLLLRQGRARLNALGRGWNRAIQPRPSGAESEGGHHEARVPEYSLRLQ